MKYEKKKTNVKPEIWTENLQQIWVPLCLWFIICCCCFHFTHNICWSLLKMCFNNAELQCIVCLNFHQTTKNCNQIWFSSLLVLSMQVYFMISWCNLFGENETRQRKRSNGGASFVPHINININTSNGSGNNGHSSNKKVVNVVFVSGFKMDVMKETETENWNSYYFGRWIA